MSRSSGAPKLSDVAGAAGVSVSTVSKVLNETGRVSDSTRARVRETAERLNFQPNALAQSFASGKSNLVAILAEDASELFSAVVIRGAEERLAKHGLGSLVLDFHEDRSRLAAEIRRLNARRVDAILVVGTGPGHPHPSISHEATAPVAYAFCASDSPADAAFLPDDFGAGKLAAEHLLSIGRRHIAHIGEGAELGAAERTRGFTAALESAGHALAHPPVLGDWSKEWGYTAMSQLLDSGHPIDAVFCANDPIAYGAYVALRTRGRAVPGDVAIIGHDHFLPEPKWRRTEFLTTIDPNLEDLGNSAAGFLIDPASTPSGVHPTPPTLVVGHTTNGVREPRLSFIDELVAVVDHVT